jgi:hypothetical protein
MPNKTFRIDSYDIGLQQRAIPGGIRIARIACKSDTNHKVEVIIIPDGDNLPDNITTIDENGIYSGVTYVYAKYYAWFVDLLRNEKPIYCTLFSETPEKNFLGCLGEPTGEEEG